MCIGIPVQLIEPGDTAAWCRAPEGRVRVDLTLVGPQPEGAWVLAFAGAAREVMTPEAAQLTLRALDALSAAMRGDASRVEDAFADLAGREPELPAHLRPKVA